MISSTKNDQVKAVIELKKKAKAREEAGLFVVEGIRMISELPKDRTKKLYVSESFLKNPERDAILSGFPDYETVTDQVFAAMSDTQTPQGVLALVRQYEYELEDLCLKDRPVLLMILENIQDPGNLGTILRTADALEIPVVMTEGCADPYSPKTIRASMGAVFRTRPVLTAPDQVIAESRRQNLPLYATALSSDARDLREVHLATGAVVIGSEGRGVSEPYLQAAAEHVIIPMNPRCESLNAATAATIVMWELHR